MTADTTIVGIADAASCRESGIWTNLARMRRGGARKLALVVGCSLLLTACPKPPDDGGGTTTTTASTTTTVASPSTTTTSTTSTTVAPTTSTSTTSTSTSTTTTVPVGSTAPWSRGFGGIGDDRATGVAVAGDGSVVLAGYFSGTVDFGGGARTAHALPWLDAYSDQDAFIAKYAADGRYLWDRTIGTEAPDHANAVAFAPNGDVVVTGWTSSYLDLGNGVQQTAFGGNDVFLATYRGSDGTFVRGRTFGSGGGDVGRSVAVDGNSNVYVAGNFQGTVDFGGGATNAAGGSTDNDGFVAKYSPTGTFVWVKAIGGASADNAAAVALDGTGNVRVAGRIGPLGSTGSTTLASAGGNDAFVAAFDTNGVTQWAKRYGGTADDEATGLASDTAGNLVVTGVFQGTNATFDGTTLTSAGLKDVFVLRTSPAGARQWAMAKGGANDESAGGVTLDTSGNVYVAGAFGGTVNFGGGAVAATGTSDAFVAKYSSAGAYAAQHKYGSLYMQLSAAIGVQSNGRVVVAGYQGNQTNASIDFGNGPITLTGGTQWDGFLGAAVP